jgi:hypothetical protein
MNRAAERPGRDAFHRVPRSFEGNGDGVESVPTVRWEALGTQAGLPCSSGPNSHTA